MNGTAILSLVLAALFTLMSLGACVDAQNAINEVYGGVLGVIAAVFFAASAIVAEINLAAKRLAPKPEPTPPPQPEPAPTPPRPKQPVYVAKGFDAEGNPLKVKVTAPDEVTAYKRARSKLSQIVELKQAES